MIRGALVVIAAAGCGRLHFDQLGDGSAPVDACTLGAFGPPQHLAALSSSSSDWGAWISNDKLEIMYSSVRTGQRELYHAVRATAGDTFDTFTLIDTGTGAGADDPYITDDGLTLYFDNYITAGDGLDILRATRATTGDPFGVAAEVTELGSTEADTAVATSTDELTVIISSQRPGRGDFDLYVATRGSKTDPFGAPSSIDALNTVGFDASASLWGDTNSLVFVSDQLTPGTRRVLMSERVGTAYQPPVMLDPGLGATTGDEVDPSITRDGMTVIFSSDRIGGLGDHDLYLAERACL